MKKIISEKIWDSESIKQEIKTNEDLWAVILDCLGASHEELVKIDDFIRNLRHIEASGD